MALAGLVEHVVVAGAGAGAVEALEADVEAIGVVLGELAEVSGVGLGSRTMESKHWVQSSR